MPDDAAPTSGKYDLRLTKSVEDMRSNAKWTLVAFGAIGTTLLAGSQLSSLGKFAVTEPRFQIAVLCALLAMASATFAVWSALKVANTGYVEFYNLSQSDIDYIERNRALLEGFETVQNLRDAYDNAIVVRHAGITAEQVDLQTFNSNEIWFQYLDGLVDIVVSYIHYNRIRTQSERSRGQLIAACIVAAISLLGFAWAANPGTEQQTVLQAPPSPAHLTLTAAGKTTLRPMLGAKCVERPAIDVIVLSIATTGWDVVTLASKDCQVARFTVTATMGKLTPETASANGAPALATPVAASERPIIWTQLRPDADFAKGELLARAIVAREAACPPLAVNGERWPMVTRTDGADADFPIKMCEAALPGDAEARLGDVTLKPRPNDPRKILVIGDTGCRIIDYAAQRCDDATDWPFFRIAKAASAMKPDLIVHVGDYHYREKPCAGRIGCTNSPYGDNWRTWNGEFFVPAAPLLTAAPWLMLRGNHEDCTRAGAGWNLLIRAALGLKPGERCPPDTDPGVFGFDKLRLVAPDTASAELDFGRADRVATYRKQIRKLSKALKAEKKETWLVTHQALWVSYREMDWGKPYDANELLDGISASFKNGVPDKLCQDIVSPMDTYRQWFAGAIPATNPHENDPKDTNEKPCTDPAPAAGQGLAAPDVSLVLSGDTHTFQMFLPDEASKRPIQLVAGNSGDALESANSYPGAGKDLTAASPTLFGVPGKLWMRHTFGFTVLERDAAGWKATLYDPDGKPLVECQLKRPNAGCKSVAKP